MKKLMTLAALVAACAPAFTAEVTSSNTVGYKKLTLQPGLNLVGTGFKVVGGGDFALKDLFHGTDVTSATVGEGADAGDYIQLFDATRKGYRKQYYFYAASNPEDADEAYDYKWYDVTDDEEPTEDIISTKDGFWYTFRGSQAITLMTSGEVSGNVTITLEPGLNLITYPFPADFDFTKLDWSAAGATAGEGADAGDYIQIFDATRKGYRKQYYFYAASNPEDADEAYDYKWYDVTDDEEPTTEKIPAYSGFWYTNRGNSSFTITFPAP